MPKLRGTRIEDRLYVKSKGETPRYYADFRDFSDVGGKQEALKPNGSRSATSDKKIAVALARARLEELKRIRRRANGGTPADRSFDALVVPYLRERRKAQEVGDQWLENVRTHLERAAQYFGSSTDLATISPRQVERYGAWLITQPNGRGGTLSGGSAHQHLCSLGALISSAVRDELLAPGVNPVRDAKKKPKIVRTKTQWLEVPEVARILRFAWEDYVPARPDLVLPWFPEVLSGLALTGCRESELLGVLLTEVDLDRRIITIQPNHFRDLKTEGSERPVRIVGQLFEILERYLNGPHAPKGELLFPSARGSKEAMITDLRKRLDLMPMPPRLRRRRTDAEIARLEEERGAMLARHEKSGPGPKPKESVEVLRHPVDEWVVPPLRTKMLRHSWAAARLQTLDNGKPVALYTVSKEMGHASMAMLEHIYAHLGAFRVRGDEVAFRW